MTATARDVVRALYRHFTPRWAVLTELTVPDPSDTAYYRRIDVLLWSPKERIAVEVKVSRADFLDDIRRPEKQEPWRAITHRHAYAVPSGLVRPEEVPPQSGLITVDFTNAVAAVGWTKLIRRDPDWQPADLPARLHHTLMIRLAEAEATVKRHSDGGESIAELKAEIDRLQRDREIVWGRENTAKARVEHLKRVLATHAPLPCETCGKPLRPKWSRRRGSEWAHAHEADETACIPLRLAAEGGRHYSERYPPAPYPAEPAEAVA